MKPHIVLLVLLGVGVIAEKNGSTWLYPADPDGEGAALFSGLNVDYGDSMLTEYTSNYPSSESDPLTMALYCGTTNIQPWDKQVPQDGTQLVSFSDFDLKNWPLPLACSFTLGGVLNYSHAPYFVLNSQDPNLSPKTWSLTTTSSTAFSSSLMPTSIPTTTLTSTTVAPTSTASTVTTAGSAVPTRPADTTTASRASNPEVSNRAIAGATVGGCVALGLSLVALVVYRCRRARRVKEREQEMVEAKDHVYVDAPTYWKPEMPADNQPTVLQEMPLVSDPGYSLAPYEMYNNETHEMPTRPGTRALAAQEMPATPIVKR